MLDISQATAIHLKVYNRGTPPIEFLETLVAWGKTAPDEVFAYSNKYDVYSHVKHRLGPWTSLTHRKAVMLEVLRVLGGFESSWNWDAGIDTTNPTSNTPCTEEAGLYQCSGNSMNFDPSLKGFLTSASGKSDCKTFRKTTKASPEFALEYCARLLRFTVKHHGPLKRKKHSRLDPQRSSIHPFLSRSAVVEFETLLET